MRICSHSLKKFFTENFFCGFFIASKYTENYCEEENKLFSKNCVGSLFTCFEKVFAICQVFTAWCLDIRF